MASRTPIVHIRNPEVKPSDIYVPEGYNQEVRIHIDQERIEGLRPTFLTFGVYRDHMGKQYRSEVMVTTGECGCP